MMANAMVGSILSPMLIRQTWEYSKNAQWAALHGHNSDIMGVLIFHLSKLLTTTSPQVFECHRALASWTARVCVNVCRTATQQRHYHGTYSHVHIKQNAFLDFSAQKTFFDFEILGPFLFFVSIFSCLYHHQVKWKFCWHCSQESPRPSSTASAAIQHTIVRWRTSSSCKTSP